MKSYAGTTCTPTFEVFFGQKRCVIYASSYDQRLSVCTFQCSASILEYNRIAHMQKLVPSTAENACGLDIELKTTTHWHKPDVFANIKVSYFSVDAS